MAEEKHSTVAKLLTGRDAPLLMLEMTLRDTYHVARKRFEQQQQRTKSGKR